ncbi:hypothetical protein NC652_036583 [Populus alba x Populus x berolinensis]|nr:hypothetical protein NC652_036583 [Populus alba x Populus x berolinensis]
MHMNEKGHLQPMVIGREVQNHASFSLMCHNLVSGNELGLNGRSVSALSAEEVSNEDNCTPTLEVPKKSSQASSDHDARKTSSLMASNFPDVPLLRPLTTPTVVHVSRPDEVEKKQKDLPIIMMEQEIMEAINEHSTVIICGETGCGKTTQVPQFLYEAGYGSNHSVVRNGGIGVTQPRRIDVLATARRFAFELGLHLGKEVRFQVRHDKRIGDNCSIKFMTDGILLREVQTDILLKRYSVIIVDEAHERSVKTDILIGMLSRVIQLRQKKYEQQQKMVLSGQSLSPENMIFPLKLVLMSATLRVEDFISERRLFHDPPPVINVPTRQFEVTVHFSKRTETREVEYLCQKLRKASTELIANTAKGRVGDEVPAMSEMVSIEGVDMKDIDEAFEIQGNLIDQQTERFGSHGEDVPDSVENESDVSYDSGSESEVEIVGDEVDIEDSKTSENDVVGVLREKSSLAALKSAFEALAGENASECKSEGKQIPSMPEESPEQYKNSMEKKTVGDKGLFTSALHVMPLYAMLPVVAQLHVFDECASPPMSNYQYITGPRNSQQLVEKFPFPTPPEAAALVEAERCLKTLEALDNTGRLTSLGKAMACYPMSPRHSRMLLTAIQITRKMKDHDTANLVLGYAVATAAALSFSNAFLKHFEGSHTDSNGSEQDGRSSSLGSNKILDNQAYKKVMSIHKRLPQGGILVFVTGQREVEYLCQKLRKASTELIANTAKWRVGDEVPAMSEMVSIEGVDMKDIDEAFEIQGNLIDQQTERFGSHDEDVPDSVENESDVSYDSGSESEVEIVGDEVDIEDSKTSENDVVGVLREKSSLAALKSAFEALAGENASECKSEGKQIPSMPEESPEQYKNSMEKKTVGDKGLFTSALHVMPLYAMLPVVAQLHVFDECASPPMSNYQYITGPRNSQQLVEKFPFPTPPEAAALVEAERCLKTLEALDNTGRLTSLGKAMACYPMSPRHSRMLLTAIQITRKMKDHDTANLVLGYAVATAAALSFSNAFLKHFEGSHTDSNGSEQDGRSSSLGSNKILDKQEKIKKKKLRETTKLSRTRFSNSTSDTLTVAYALHCFELSTSPVGFCHENGLHLKTMEEMSKLRRQLLQLVFNHHVHELEQGFSWTHGTVEDVEQAWRVLSSKRSTLLNVEDILGQAICAGWVDRVAKRIRGNSGSLEGDRKASAVRYQACMVKETVFLHRRSSLSNSAPEFLVYSELLHTKRPYMHGATSIKPEWLAKYGVSLCSFSTVEDRKPEYDPQTDQLYRWVIPTFGPHLWRLPAQSMPISSDEDRLKDLAAKYRCSCYHYFLLVTITRQNCESLTAAISQILMPQKDEFPVHFLSKTTNLSTAQYLAFVGKQNGSLKSEERFTNVLKIHVIFPSLRLLDWRRICIHYRHYWHLPLKASCRQWHKRNIFFKQV